MSARASGVAGAVRGAEFVFDVAEFIGVLPRRFGGDDGGEDDGGSGDQSADADQDDRLAERGADSGGDRGHDHALERDRGRAEERSIRGHYWPQGGSSPVAGRGLAGALG